MKVVYTIIVRRLDKKRDSDKNSENDDGSKKIL